MAGHNPARHLILQPDNLQKHIRRHDTLASPALTACFLCMSSTHKLIRDCAATLIPAGDVVVLESGTEVTVTQALGGSVTVRTPMGLFRIAPADIEALGTDAVSQYGKKDEAVISGPVNQEALWEALKGCFDPEIPVNIVELGLVYDCDLGRNAEGERTVAIRMTLTAPGCGMGDILVQDVRDKVERVPTIVEADVELVFDPPWNQTMMSDAARLETGIF